MHNDDMVKCITDSCRIYTVDTYTMSFRLSYQSSNLRIVKLFKNNLFKMRK